MPYADHNPRRMRTSEVPHVPVRRHHAPRPGQQLLLALAVGFTMLIIVSLYAASFRYQNAVRSMEADHPRWSFLDEDLLARTMPVRQELSKVKETLVRLTSAGKTQAQAALILKAKIQARALSPEASAKGDAASGTSETP